MRTARLDIGSPAPTDPLSPTSVGPSRGGTDARDAHPLDDLWKPSSYYRPTQPSIYVIEPPKDEPKDEPRTARRMPFGFVPWPDDSPPLTRELDWPE